MKHPYSEILIAIADVKEIQLQQPDGSWQPTPYQDVLGHIQYGSVLPKHMRIKPATVTINGVEVEGPVPNDYNWLRVHTQVSQKTITFATPEARDAAYAALIKPFGSAS